tara:strand:- start:2220 stop:2690 length:471 start_codon:yes stop_codon:yes gene_type:complete
METAQQVINDALQEILVQASEQPIQTVDFQTARRYLNRMMTTVPFSGLGYTTVTLPSDLVTIPDAALEGVVFNLAKRLLSTYDMPLTAELLQSAKDGLNEIRRITVKVQPTSMPCTLPIGSGNEQENTFNNQHFYPCPSDEIATEQGGSILLESDT